MKKRNYSDELANIVKKFLTDDEWHYIFDEELGIFEFNVKSSSKIQKVKYLIDVKEKEIVIYGICPINAECDDEKMMAQMAEFVCRANYGIKNGNFELDFRDGEVRYKSYIDCENENPSTEVIKRSIFYIAIMFERYGNGITSIVFAGDSAKKAIDMCENTQE